MTKLLYIPNGTYINFWSGGDCQTEIIEQSYGWNYNSYTHPLEMLIYIFKDDCSPLRERNDLPINYDIEEFEVIYD